MKSKIFMAIALFSVSAFAGDPDLTVNASKVAAVVTEDLNKDYLMDRALLVEGEAGELNLLVYFSNSDATELKLVANRSNFAFGGLGTMAAVSPTLAVNKLGQLEVTYGNDGVGRTHWTQTVTIATVEGKLTVVGFSYLDYDLHTDKSNSCKVDLVTQKGTRNRKKFVTTTKATSIEEWNSDSRPQGCEQE